MQNNEYEWLKVEEADADTGNAIGEPRFLIEHGGVLYETVAVNEYDRAKAEGAQVGIIDDLYDQFLEALPMLRCVLFTGFVKLPMGGGAGRAAQTQTNSGG